MKAPLLLVCVVALTLVSFGQIQKDFSPASSTASSIDQNWYNQAKALIHQREYAFRQTENKVFVANSAQRIGFEILDAGFSVFPIKMNDESFTNWKHQLNLRSISKGIASLAPISGQKVHGPGNTLLMHFPGFTIEYMNNEQGLRQNFIVEQRPAGDGQLTALLDISGDLTAVVQNN